MNLDAAELSALLWVAKPDAKRPSGRHLATLVALGLVTAVKAPELTPLGHSMLLFACSIERGARPLPLLAEIAALHLPATAPALALLREPQQVLVLTRPELAVGSIRVGKHQLRIRSCPRCRVYTTEPMCPCCRETTEFGGLSESPPPALIPGPGTVSPEGFVEATAREPRKREEPRTPPRRRSR